MSKIRFRMVLAVMVTIVGFASVGYAQTNKLKFTSLDFPGGNLTTGRGINNHGDIVGWGDVIGESFDASKIRIDNRAMAGRRPSYPHSVQEGDDGGRPALSASVPPEHACAPPATWRDGACFCWCAGHRRLLQVNHQTVIGRGDLQRRPFAHDLFIAHGVLEHSVERGVIIRRFVMEHTIVLDVGAQYSGYSADITRTLPANGKFTARQREIYEIVLGAQNAALAAMKPGTHFSCKGKKDGLMNIAYDYINSHGKDRQGRPLGQYFIHGLGHHIGLNVHDPGDYCSPLQPGMVVTVEPGIYIPEENLGVRIEDDVLITESGHKLLSERLPRNPDEIEKIMADATKEAVHHAGSPAGNGSSPSGNEKGEEEIKSLITKYAQSVDDADTNLASQVWCNSPEASFIHPLGHEHGFEQIKENVYNKLMGGMFSERKLTAHDVSVQVLGDAAVAEFYWDFVAKFRKDGSPISTHGRETQVYRKTSDGWRLVHVHYSGMPVTTERRGF